MHFYSAHAHAAVTHAAVAHAILCFDCCVQGVSFENFRHGVLEQGIFGDIGGGGGGNSEDSFDLDMSEYDEDEDEGEDENVDLLQEITENLRPDKAGRVTFSELERSISLCIGSLLADDDREKMATAFVDIEEEEGKGVPLDSIATVLMEWMSSQSAEDAAGDDQVEQDQDFGRARKNSFHSGAGTSFFVDDGDEQSQIYHEMEVEVGSLRKKLAAASQESMKLRHTLQSVQQNQYMLEQREKDSRLAVARLNRKLRDTEVNLTRALDEEGNLQSTVSGLEQALKRKTEEVKRAVDALSAYKERQAAKAAGMRRDGEVLTPKSGEIDSLRKQLRREEQKVRTLKDEVELLRDELTEAKAQSEVNAAKYEKSKITIKQLGTVHEEHLKEISELKESIATLNYNLENRVRTSSAQDIQAFQNAEWLVARGSPDTPMGTGLSPINGIDSAAVDGRARPRFESDTAGLTSLAMDLESVQPGDDDDEDPIDGAIAEDGESVAGDEPDDEVQEAAQPSTGPSEAESAQLVAKVQAELDSIKADHAVEVANFQQEVKRLEVELKMTNRRNKRAGEEERRKLKAQLQEEAQQQQEKLQEEHEQKMQELKAELTAVAESSGADHVDPDEFVKLQSQVRDLETTLETVKAEAAQELSAQTADAATKATAAATAAAREEFDATTKQLQSELKAKNEKIVQLQAELAKVKRASASDSNADRHVGAVQNLMQTVLMPQVGALKADDASSELAPVLPTPAAPATAVAKTSTTGGGSVQFNVKKVLRSMMTNPTEFSTTDNAFNAKRSSEKASLSPELGGKGKSVHGRRVTTGTIRSRRSKGKSRRKSQLYSVADAVMPENHKPSHAGSLERYVQSKFNTAQRKATALRRTAHEGRSKGQRHNLEMAIHLESFFSQACAQVSSFKGDYRSITQNLALRAKMKEKGMEPGEQIVFSTVLHRCVPAFLFFSTKKKRTLILTTKAIYEIETSLTYNIRRRLAYKRIGRVSISTAAADVFALLPRDHFDLLYQTMRRTEIVARMMQCYEAEVGQQLKLGFMHTIILAMENGDMKTTYVDEETATVKMVDYKQTQATMNQGFICPNCKQKYVTSRNALPSTYTLFSSVLVLMIASVNAQVLFRHQAAKTF